MKNSATLIISASEADSNLYYACRFLVPDPIIYFEIGGKKHLVLSDLEIDRAKMQATVDKILSLSALSKKIQKNPKHTDLPAYARVAHVVFSEKKIRELVVPADFGSRYYEAFKKLGYKITVKPDPFFEARLCKTKEEKNCVKRADKHVANALWKAVAFLQEAKIRGNRIFHGKTVVTSQLVRQLIDTDLMKNGCVASHTIVASGVQGSYPHHEGHGPLLPHTPIIFDIFPRDSHSRYWGDMTRTMVKGKPSETVRKMFNAVLAANKTATALVKEGVDSQKVHIAAQKTLEKAGFKTGMIDGRMQGFIHGTGHGLGLDVHELPSVSSRGAILKAGNIITIEPGLYYEKHGGIRLEDDLYVTKTGSERLTNFPKVLELDELDLPKS